MAKAAQLASPTVMNRIFRTSKQVACTDCIPVFPSDSINIHDTRDVLPFTWYRIILERRKKCNVEVIEVTAFASTFPTRWMDVLLT
jgi:hypothetical protein